jgi:hypothetical protein
MTYPAVRIRVFAFLCRFVAGLRFPELWAQLNREAVQEAGLDGMTGVL